MALRIRNQVFTRDRIRTDFISIGAIGSLVYKGFYFDFDFFNVYT